MPDNRRRPNGDGADAFGVSPVQAISAAVERAVASVLPQAIAAAVSVFAAPPQHCATCLAARFMWENRHERQVTDALAAACVAQGIDPGSPQAGDLDFAPHLPDGLRPGQDDGLPPLRMAATIADGTAVCVFHMPGVKRTLLVAGGARPSGGQGS